MTSTTKQCVRRKINRSYACEYSARPSTNYHNRFVAARCRWRLSRSGKNRFRSTPLSSMPPSDGHAQCIGKRETGCIVINILVMTNGRWVDEKTRNLLETVESISNKSVLFIKTYWNTYSSLTAIIIADCWKNIDCIRLKTITKFEFENTCD